MINLFKYSLKYDDDAIKYYLIDQIKFIKLMKLNLLN
jgi:hypothetical protein